LPPLWHGTAQGSAATEEEIEMKYAPLAKRKRKSKAGPVLGAAGLSLTLASGASAANTGPVQDTLTRNAGLTHEITLREEEISEVSLATFYVLDKEGTEASRPGVRLAMGVGGCAGCSGCGGWTGTYYTSSVVGNDAYSPPPPRLIRPAHKHVQKTR
jgi:hypothetical protein